MAWRFIICILILLFLSAIASASSLDASDWSFRREIVLSDSKALSDYQVRVSFDTKSLVAEGKMRSDCADIRFTDSDKFSTLSYFLESGCNTNDTLFWVKVPIVYSENKFFVYYGFSAAESESSGEGVFLFFDGFDGNSIDPSKWFPHECVSVYGGYARMYSKNDPCYLKLDIVLPEAGVIQLKARRGPEETGVGPGFTVSYEDNLPVFEMAADPKEKRWMLYSRKPAPTSIYGGVLDLDDHVFSVAYDVSGHLYYFYADSFLISKNRAFLPGSFGSLNLLAGGISNGGSVSDSYYDYFFIRKYADPEPKIDIRGEESLKPASTPAHEALDEPISSSSSLATTLFSATSAVVTSSFSASSSFTEITRAASSDNIVSKTSLVDTQVEKNYSDVSSPVSLNSRSVWDFFYPLLLAVFVIVLLFLFMGYRKRKAESLKENKEVLRWIAKELLSGENPEVIKKAVSDSGMDPSIVDKAKKTLK
jgi:hypothetical protein